MPSPDFQQIALTLAQRMGAPADAIDPLVEQLRFVWNARGAVDIREARGTNCRP